LILKPSPGNFSGCHSVAWDANSLPNTGDRKLTNQFTKSGYPLGIMLNSDGKRFVDEGVDLRNFTYAKFGREILKQPNAFAFQVWDADGEKWLRSEEYGDDVTVKIRADTIEDLASKLVEKQGLLDREAFIDTLKGYNEGVQSFKDKNGNLKFDPSIKDGIATLGVLPPKTNWALPIIKGPFIAVKVVCGVTFTFGGLAVNPDTAAVVSNSTNKDVPGLFAAGEIVGGAFYGNYPGGSGLTIGAILGRKAGKTAAMLAQKTESRKTNLSAQYTPDLKSHL